MTEIRHEDNINHTAVEKKKNGFFISLMQGLKVLVGGPGSGIGHDMKKGYGDV